MRVRDVMRGEVYALSPTATAAEAARLMEERNIGAVAVVADGKLVGIVTERDLARKIVARGRDPASARLLEVMTPSPVSVDPDTPLMEALRLMTDLGVRHLPVVRNGVLEGMLSIRDIARAVAEAGCKALS